jgi:hypothetical protein
MARVSVVLPTANCRESLLATVESILNQSFTDLELLVADDASTDGSGLEFLMRFGPDKSKAERAWRESLRESTGTRSIRMFHGATLIHYLHQVTPRGPSAARNRAVALASGELLAFAEAGDLWLQRKLDHQVELLERSSEIGACLECPSARKRKPTSRKRPCASHLNFEDVLEASDLRLSGSLLRRACLDIEAPFDENLPVCEDFDFWLRIGSRHTLARLEEPLQTHGPGRTVREWGLERFRVYALEKAYQGGHLSPTMRHRVAEELVCQCTLLVDGYRDRDNQERANFYDRKRKRFSQEVAKLDVSDPVFTGVRGGRPRLSGAPV